MKWDILSGKWPGKSLDCFQQIPALEKTEEKARELRDVSAKSHERSKCTKMANPNFPRQSGKKEEGLVNRQ